MQTVALEVRNLLDGFITQVDEPVIDRLMSKDFLFAHEMEEFIKGNSSIQVGEFKVDGPRAMGRGAPRLKVFHVTFGDSLVSVYWEDVMHTAFLQLSEDCPVLGNEDVIRFYRVAQVIQSRGYPVNRYQLF